MQRQLSLRSSPSFHQDMIKVVNRLPYEAEYRRVRNLEIPRLEDSEHVGITDDLLAIALENCPHLETVDLSGVHDMSDRTLITLAGKASNLQVVEVGGVTGITDIGEVGIMELCSKDLPLNTIHLNAVKSLTDASIIAIARSCTLVVDLDLSDLPMLTCLSIRDIWSFSRKLRTLKLAHCPLVNDKAFPSDAKRSPSMSSKESDKPLPPRPNTWLDDLPPLILTHTNEALRVLDLTACPITDAAIRGIVKQAPKIQSLVLSECSELTDLSLEYISLLGPHLDVLLLDRIANITDKGLIRVARACHNLRAIDVSFCRNLTDQIIHELADLSSLRRLSLVRVQKLTDIALFALAQYSKDLERLHISYCDRLSLDALHLLLKKLPNLQHLAATGIPSLKRPGIARFSDRPPEGLDSNQQAAFRVFNGHNVAELCRFLDKEKRRKEECETRNIPFTEREDDGEDLY